jgi:hypothetical protein
LFEISQGIWYGSPREAVFTTSLNKLIIENEEVARIIISASKPMLHLDGSSRKTFFNKQAFFSEDLFAYCDAE